MSHGKPKLGISSCLLGEELRYDGGHKRDRYLTEVLGPWVDWVPVCPEYELGLGVPREPLRLERGANGTRLVGIESGRDLSEEMNAWCGRRLEELGILGLRGYVLKQNSPSCGMAEVPLHDGTGAPAGEGSGLFAAALMAALPSLPVEEEGRLDDARLRENFVARVFAYDRWRRLREDGSGPGDLVRFHAAHKMQLLAHHPEGYRRLGRLVARAGEGRGENFAALLDRYEAGFMRALEVPATPGRHLNVLQHLCGFMGDDVPAADRSELAELMEGYRRGEIPLAAPLDRLRRLLEALEQPWPREQSYLDPYPRELGPRGHV